MKNFKPFIICFLLFALIACKVTFISGYDPIIDQKLTQIKHDFNLHFIRLARVIQDNDPKNQDFNNFLDYYDNLEVDLMVLNDRTAHLDKKARIVKNQISNLDSVMHAFIIIHKKGLPDRNGDDRREIRNGINSSLNATIKLQEQLKSTNKAKP